MTKEEITKEKEDLSKLLASLNKEELIAITKRVLSDGVSVFDLIKKRKEITDMEIYDLIKKEDKKHEILEIPISVLDNKELSALEAIVKYLKENLKLRYNEIAAILNRDERNIWTTYRNAKIKRKKKFVLKKTDLFIPLKIFQNRNLSVLENLVSYLKEKENLTYRKIAKLLNRNERTIWTVYHRAGIKGG